MFDAGSGTIGNYDSCSFNIRGNGTFRGNDQSNPFAGERGKVHNEQETRIEVIYERHLESKLLHALKSNHPYEEVAYDCYPLLNSHPGIGSGLTGFLHEAMDEKDFLSLLKTNMQTGCIRHTELVPKKVK